MRSLLSFLALFLCARDARAAESPLEVVLASGFSETAYTVKIDQPLSVTITSGEKGSFVPSFPGKVCVGDAGCSEGDAKTWKQVFPGLAEDLVISEDCVSAACVISIPGQALNSTPTVVSFTPAFSGAKSGAKAVSFTFPAAPPNTGGPVDPPALVVLSATSTDTAFTVKRGQPLSVTVTNGDAASFVPEFPGKVCVGATGCQAGDAKTWKQVFPALTAEPVLSTNCVDAACVITIPANAMNSGQTVVSFTPAFSGTRAAQKPVSFTWPAAPQSGSGYASGVVSAILVPSLTMGIVWLN